MAKKKGENKKKHLKNHFIAWRKCPFCSAINPPNRLKCHNCGLKYPFPLEKENKVSDAQFSARMLDPRPQHFKILDYIQLLAPLLFLVYPLVKDYIALDKLIFELKWIEIGLIALGLAIIIIYIVRLKFDVQEQCRNCGKIMIARIPAVKQGFPNSIECWNCGAIHYLEWAEDSEEKITAT